MSHFVEKHRALEWVDLFICLISRFTYLLVWQTFIKFLSWARTWNISVNEFSILSLLFVLNDHIQPGVRGGGWGEWGGGFNSQGGCLYPACKERPKLAFHIIIKKFPAIIKRFLSLAPYVDNEVLLCWIETGCLCSHLMKQDQVCKWACPGSPLNLCLSSCTSNRLASVFPY